MIRYCCLILVTMLIMVSSASCQIIEMLELMSKMRPNFDGTKIAIGHLSKVLVFDVKGKNVSTLNLCNNNLDLMDCGADLPPNLVQVRR
jgi:hypothetical protein